MRISARHITFLFAFILMAASGLFYSCTKVININLNSASPLPVVQGNINNQPGTYAVILSQSVNFSDPNTFPPIPGALVTINDNLGNIDTLKDSIPGNYTGHKLMGTPGRTYTLSISSNGKFYSAASTMPQPIAIDSLTIQNDAFSKKNKFVVIHFQSPQGAITYYHFVATVNNVTQTPIFAFSDEYQLGNPINFELRSPNDSLKIKSGDTVMVQLQSTDQNIFNYYTALFNAGGTGFDTAPANPPSNISNSALGYFSAYAVTSKTIIVP